MPALIHTVSSIDETEKIHTKSSSNSTENTNDQQHNDDHQKQTNNDNNNNQQQSFEDKYFPMIMSNIGSYEQFNKQYTKNIDDIVGRGNESIVYSGKCITNGDNIAVHETIFKSKAELIYWFVKYLSVKECNFYSLYEAFIGPQSDDSHYTVILVEELLDANITQIMSSNTMMDESEVQNMIHQICTQLSVLNQTQNYVHLDIKPTNIMRRRSSTTTGSNGECQHRQEGQEEEEKLKTMYTLIDFGFAMEINSIYHGYLGTKEWSAPEMKPIENGDNKIHESTDMWSIGLLIIYCMFNGTHPLCDGDHNNSANSFNDILNWYNSKINGKRLFIQRWIGKQLFDSKISYNLFDFLTKSLKFDPLKRLTPTTALQHKWLKSL